MRPFAIAFALLFLVPVLAAAHSSGHDHEGTILVGTGRVALAPGRDHVLLYSSSEAIGFDYTGDIRYDVTNYSFGDGVVREVRIMAPLGARDVAFTLDWVYEGTPTVAFGLPPNKPTNCADLLCAQ